MTECIHYRDRCKSRIECDRILIEMQCGMTPTTMPVNHATGRPSIDLCPQCFDTLMGWLAASKGE